MMEQRTPGWHRARVGRITASIVGGILGHSPYMKREDAMRLLVREALGAEREFTGNIATEWGEHNEDGAIIDFQFDTGLTVEKVGFITYEDWAGASPDGLTSDGGGIEQKCPFSLRDAPAPVPFKPLYEQPHYYDQIQFTLFVTGRPHWWFSQWAPHGTSLERVEPDMEWLNDNLPRLRQFHAEFLDELANNADDHLGPARPVIDTPDAWRMMGEYEQITESLELLGERKTELLAQMVDLAGGKNSMFAGRRLTLTERKGAISYSKAIKVLAPNADLEKWRGKGSSFWGVK